MPAPDQPPDRSTGALSDPLPHTPAAAAMRDALPDPTVDPGNVHGGHARGDTPAGTRDAAAEADDARAGAAPGVHAGDEVGEAVGGISGVLTGAALGSLGGPIGTIIGGVAGAVSGWWAGRTISEAAYHASHDDDAFYRDRHAAAGAPAGRGYEDVRPAYQLGHVAGRNPDYRGRTFDDVEADLRHGWSDAVSARHGRWDEVRGYARDAFERSRATAPAPGSLDAGAASRGGGV